MESKEHCKECGQQTGEMDAYSMKHYGVCVKCWWEDSGFTIETSLGGEHERKLNATG